MRAVLCGLALLSSAALGQSFVRSTVKDHPELPFFWKSRCLVYHLSTQGSPRTPGRTEDVAIANAFDTWRRAGEACSNGWDFARGEDVSPGDFHIGRQGKVNSTQIIFRQVACRDVVPADDPCGADPETARVRCENAYQCFDPEDDDALAITTTTVSTRTGELLDADIEFNDTPQHVGPLTLESRLFTTVDSPACALEAPAPTCVAYDLQNTLTHEIGHVLGFAHTEDPASTMYKWAFFGETSKRKLDEGSQEGLCSVYPAAAPTDDVCTQSISDPLSSQTARIHAQTSCAALPAEPLLLGLVAWWGSRRRRYVGPTPTA
jgi:Matrixin